MLFIYTGEKPYQCTVCFKRFAHQSDVKRHSTTHTGIYVCISLMSYKCFGPKLCEKKTLHM